MHEYSLVLSLLDRVATEAHARQAVSVRRLSVRVGELGGVNADLLRAAYALARVGTVCAGAPLDIAAVPAHWACKACGETVTGDGPRRCHACGAPARLIAGDELVLERIELEVPDV
jgi:hydrogenase nickel incorporation protein HypA/HybF